MYSENFGNTVLEAMQRGLPVIPEVGAAEIVRTSGAGLDESDPRPLGATGHAARMVTDVQESVTKW